ncbi:MAG: LD-carboxypeptidase [Methylacidiphilales bacterium]|nr:LD-carboxypeptidase [Candidatus Methylacidiphilales bacterium]
MRAPSILFPSRLAAGDVVGIAAPASPPDQPEKINEVIRRLTAYGFRIKPGKYLRKRNGYLAGSDEERAGDINELFTDPKVKGIFALRGGYGSCRILPLLDYAAIRANPKPFIGYSDITAMQLAILARAGVVTFHGSNATSAFEPGNEAAFRRVLMDALGPKGTVLFSRGNAGGKTIKTVTPGRVTGRLLGGNMTCLLRLIGTPYAPDFRGAILFLEDTGEKAYRVDGMFTHLRLAGVLPQIVGLVLGRFDHTDAAEQKRITACLQREAKRTGIPCVSGAPIGHFAEQIVVPQGTQAELDAGEGILKVK